MDMSPLLYVHVGLPVEPTKACLVTLTFDLLTLKVVSESRVTWATSVPILVFLGLSVLELVSNCMRQTDRRQTKASLNTPPIRGGGIIRVRTILARCVHRRWQFGVAKLTLRRARLVLGWATVSVRYKLPNSTQLSRPSVGRRNEYQRKAVVTTVSLSLSLSLSLSSFRQLLKT